jgi:radical SAM protein with 4Fe4S-binding SPASM domain
MSTETRLQDRQPFVQDLPQELYLETTNRCNLKCRTCPQFWGMEEDAADLAPERVRHLLAQFPTVSRVVLHGIGEPLLNRDLFEIIRAVKDRGAYALFNTNGLLLRGHLLQKIARCGLDELRVSLDAASPETYERVRGANAFDRILENLRQLKAVKSDLALLTPKVSLWLTGMKTNVHELPALVRLAAEIGIAEVYLQRLVFSDRGLALQDEALYRRAGEAEIEAVRRAEELAETLGITLRGSGEASSGSLLPSPDGAGSYRACRRPWTLMYVTANGNILPCCIAPFTGVAYESIVLGNIFEQTAEEIWNGPRYQNWRRGMLEGKPPAACAGCGSGWSL